MGKFKYRMQNILDIKQKLEEQAKNEYAMQQQILNDELSALDALKDRLLGYERASSELKQGGLKVRELVENQNAQEIMKGMIEQQLEVVKRQEAVVEQKRLALTEVMQERKTHEKLKEKAFEQFMKDELAAESKAIDELTSYTYGKK